MYGSKGLKMIRALIYQICMVQTKKQTKKSDFKFDVIHQLKDDGIFRLLLIKLTDEMRQKFGYKKLITKKRHRFIVSIR